MTTSSISRRSFLSTAVLAAAAVPLMKSSASAAAANPAIWTSARKIGGFYLGPQAWTFNKFTAMEAVEFAGRAGAGVIEFFPGQPFSKDKPGLKWDNNATDDQHKEMADHLAKWKVVPANFGVTGIPNDEREARKTFDFAKRLGLYGITTESTESIELIDKLAQEYGIHVGYHNHPKQENNPKYRVWDPNYILELVKDRSPFVGSCADTGHWERSGLDPLAAIKLLKGRVISSHFKDRVDIKSEDVPYGTGKSPLISMLEELRAQDFKGNISIEFEANWDHNLPDVAQCIGFVRGLGAAKGWS